MWTPDRKYSKLERRPRGRGIWSSIQTLAHGNRSALLAVAVCGLCLLCLGRLGTHLSMGTPAVSSTPPVAGGRGLSAGGGAAAAALPSPPAGDDTTAAPPQQRPLVWWLAPFHANSGLGTEAVSILTSLLDYGGWRGKDLLLSHSGVPRLVCRSALLHAPHSTRGRGGEHLQRARRLW